MYLGCSFFSCIINVFIKITISDETITGINADISFVLTNDDFQSINNNMNALRQVCDNIQENIYEIKSMMSIILNRINTLEMKGVMGEYNDEENISKLIPLKGIDDLLNIEEILKSDGEISKQLVSTGIYFGFEEKYKCLSTNIFYHT